MVAFAFTGTSGNDLVVFTENSLNALANTHKGSNPPQGVVAGQMWIDDTNDPTSWLLKVFDGTDHISVASIDPTNNAVTPYSGGQLLGSAANKDSGTATGEVPVLGANGLPAVGGGDLTGTQLKSLKEAIKTATYTVVAGDAGKMLIANSGSAVTFDLTASVTMGAGWTAMVKNVGAGTLTIDPNGSETIDGAATMPLEQDQWTIIWADSSNWRSFGPMESLRSELDALKVDQIMGMIENPAAKTYTIDLNGKFAYDVEELTIQLSAGTITAALKIDGTAITGISAAAVTTTEQTFSATAANSLAVGQTLTLVTTADSTTGDLFFTVKIRRT